MQLPRTPVVVALVALLLLARGGTPAAAACTPLTGPLVATASVAFCPGVYPLPDRQGRGAIVVGADDITLDGNGLTLDGGDGRGYGIALDGHTGVTIANFTIRHYYDAIRVANAAGIRIVNDILSDNGGPEEDLYDVNRPLAGEYGGGILLVNVANSMVYRTTASGGNVGVDLYASDGNTIAEGHFSDNHGWGIRLYQSSGNILTANEAERVGGCRGDNCDARDSAGILLVHASNRNEVTGNRIRYGGDGFYIGNGAPGSLPSDDNVVTGNDGSFAVHNAFEATFSRNTFANNVASNSRYGFWLGYSHDTAVRGNVVAGNAVDGINWDRGYNWDIGGNKVTGNGGAGIAFTDADPRNRGGRVAENTLGGNGDNLSVGGGVGVAATRNNLLCAYAGRTCRYNAVSAGAPVDATGNWWGTAVTADARQFKVSGPVAVGSPLPAPVGPPAPAP